MFDIMPQQTNNDSEIDAYWRTRSEEDGAAIRRTLLLDAAQWAGAEDAPSTANVAHTLYGQHFTPTPAHARRIIELCRLQKPGLFKTQLSPADIEKNLFAHVFHFSKTAGAKRGEESAVANLAKRLVNREVTPEAAVQLVKRDRPDLFDGDTRKLTPEEIRGLTPQQYREIRKTDPGRLGLRNY
jgi:hypothetical protein